MSRTLNAPLAIPDRREPCCGTGKKVFSVEYQRILNSKDYAGTKSLRVLATSYAQVEKYVLGLSEYPGMKIVINHVCCSDEIDAIL